MNFFKNRILITGGAGSIGNELVRQLAPKNNVYILDINETGMFDLVEELGIRGRIGNIRDIWTVEDVFEEFEPDIVFHVAALKHVTPSSATPKEYTLTNEIGTYNIIDCCKKFGSKLINISTDKVVNSNSVMGATKRVAEIAVRDAGFVSVRFGNVMESRGSLLTIWKKQYEEGLPLTITDERMERYFMTIPEAVNLVIRASQIAKGGEVVILDMGRPIKIIDLKKELYGDYPIRIIGIRPGETLTEKLMTDDEAQKARKVGNFWII